MKVLSGFLVYKYNKTDNFSEPYHVEDILSNVNYEILTSYF